MERSMFARLVGGIVVMGLVLTATGCATLFNNGGRKNISFSSEPDRAKVYVDGQLIGTTPIQLQLSAKKSYNVEFRKDGYSTRTTILNTSLDAKWVALNLLTYGVGLIVDLSTGACYKFDQDHVAVAMEKDKE